MKVQEYNCAIVWCSSYNNVSFYFFTSIDKKQKPSRQANDEQNYTDRIHTGESEKKEKNIIVTSNSNREKKAQLRRYKFFFFGDQCPNVLQKKILNCCRLK